MTEQAPFEDFGAAEFADNPEPRCPCVLILDTSSSMSGEPIRELNDGLATYREELMEDGLAAKRVEVALITFGGEAKVVHDFATAESFFAPTLKPSGHTPMGEAVSRGLDLLEQRKGEYKANGVAYYRPWVFLITDGAPTDDWEQAADRSRSEDAENRYMMFSVGVEGADFKVLSRFSNREPLRLKGLRFRELFAWLSSSQKQVSQSNPGDRVPLEDPTAGPKGWAAVV